MLCCFFEISTEYFQTKHTSSNHAFVETSADPPSLNPSSEAMMFMHSILTPYLMATQPSNSEAKETGLIRLLQVGG